MKKVKIKTPNLLKDGHGRKGTVTRESFKKDYKTFDTKELKYDARLKKRH